MRLLENLPRLYAIADMEICLKKNISLIEFAHGFFSGGGRVLQYRDKISTEAEIAINTDLLIQEALHWLGKVILNDRVNIAREKYIPVHVGQDNTQKIDIKFGRSTHDENEILSAVNANVQPDYIGLGAVFPSSTKTNVNPLSIDKLLGYCDLWKHDIVFIGGITLDNVLQLPQGDRFFYAVISDLFSFKNAGGNSVKDIANYTEKFLNKLANA